MGKSKEEGGERIGGGGRRSWGSMDRGSFLSGGEFKLSEV